MTDFEKLESKLNTYSWGVHKHPPFKSPNFIISQALEQIKKVKNAAGDEKYLHEKELINLCRGVVSYCEARNIYGDIRNIFAKFLSKLETECSQVELCKTLNYVISF